MLIQTPVGHPVRHFPAIARDGAMLCATEPDNPPTFIIFGRGGISLHIIQGARMAGAKMIIGVDLKC